MTWKTTGWDARTTEGSVRGVLTHALDARNFVADEAVKATEFFGELENALSYMAGAYTYCFYIGLITEDEYHHGLRKATGCDQGTVERYTTEAMKRVRAAAERQKELDEEGMTDDEKIGEW